LCRITRTCSHRQGKATAADLAKRFGIDIRKRKFWDDSLAIIGQRIDRFSEI
jgi:oligoendopeptidase F